MSGTCPCGGETFTPPGLCSWEMPHWGLGYNGGERCEECGFVWGLKNDDKQETL